MIIQNRYISARAFPTSPGFPHRANVFRFACVRILHMERTCLRAKHPVSDGYCMCKSNIGQFGDWLYRSHCIQCILGHPYLNYSDMFTCTCMRIVYSCVSLCVRRDVWICVMATSSVAKGTTVIKLRIRKPRLSYVGPCLLISTHAIAQCEERAALCLYHGRSCVYTCTMYVCTHCVQHFPLFFIYTSLLN